ncbi:kinase-like protein [Aureobasidium subglaciale]|nr:kinase-like protein [Aureobasidium subglaciale]
MTITKTKASKTQSQKATKVDMALLMVGMSAVTYRIHDTVIKFVHADDEALLTQSNVDAMRNEASLYRILGQHDRIAECLDKSSAWSFIMLKYYPHGDLKNHVAKNGRSLTKQLKRWARQIIEGVAKVHRNGIRHSDLRLDQWLVDEDLNARLCDFNASGYDANKRLDLPASKALGLESYSHYMPRDPELDNTDLSDLFALGSALYELEAGEKPFAGEEGEIITEHFEVGRYPEVDALSFGGITGKCWKGEFETALDLLHAGEKSCGL